MADEDGGRGARDAGHVVVLGEPEAREAETLGVAGEVERVAVGLRDGAAGPHGSEVENRITGHYRLTPITAASRRAISFIENSGRASRLIPGPQSTKTERNREGQWP